MSNENLKLWDKVEKTNESLITEVDDGNGKKFKSIASINRIKKATEIFGIYGDKWGLKDLKHSDLKIASNMIIATLDATFFCEYNNKNIEFEISNSFPITYVHDGKFAVNYSYRKSIETDTLGKALSRFGFNADIYTDGELVESEKMKSVLSDEDLIEIGVDLKSDE